MASEPRSRTVKPKYVKLNLRISESHREKLDAVATKLGLQRSELVRRLIDEEHARQFGEEA